MNANAVTFVLAELLFSVQVPVWIFYAQEWRGAAGAVAGATVAYLLFRWNEQ